ncbi:MAG: response regulator transcription factor, partial [Cyanobacteria bacterium P01_E01_bin.35]
GIRVLLEKATEIEIVGAVKDGESALEKIAVLQPDVVLLDISLPGIDGLTVANKINFKFPQVKVIILSSHEDESYVSQAMDSGAEGYLLKSISSEELEWSIKLVYQGYSAFKSELLTTFTAAGSTKKGTPGDNLDSLLKPLSPQPWNNNGKPLISDHISASSSRVTTKKKSHRANDIYSKPSHAVAPHDAELAKMETLLARNHIHQQYSKYATYGRQHRGSRIIDSVKLNQIKKTLASFEFKLLVLIILFALGFLVFVALS